MHHIVYFYFLQPEYLFASDDDCPQVVSIKLAAKAQVEELRKRVDDLYDKYEEMKSELEIVASAQKQATTHQIHAVIPPAFTPKKDSSVNIVNISSETMPSPISVSLTDADTCLSTEYSPPILPQPLTQQPKGKAIEYYNTDRPVKNKYSYPDRQIQSQYHPYNSTIYPPYPELYPPLQSPIPMPPFQSPNPMPPFQSPNPMSYLDEPLAELQPSPPKAEVKREVKKSCNDYSPHRLVTLRAQSCSRGNFATNLMRELYTEQERLVSNVRGKNSKKKFSPNRMDKIRAASFDMFPLRHKEKEKEAWAECIKAIDGCNRTLRIKREA